MREAETQVIAPAPQPSDPRLDVVRTVAVAFALDETARAAGRADRAAGRPFQPGDHDMLAYAFGYRRIP